MSFLIIFILFPMTVVLVIIDLLTGRALLRQIFILSKGVLAYVWIPLLGLIFLLITFRFFTEKKELKKSEIYGQYIIDRTKFPGKQADWQYNHFRFEITPQNEFLFYLTDKEKIIKTYAGKVRFLDEYRQPRIILYVNQPRYHIIEDKPTLYRNIWDFYYVFYSPKFGNVFFTKGKWKPID